MKIVPAILTDNSKDFQNKISQVEKFGDLVQIDIMDGKFVPSKSVGIEVLSDINTTLELEFHLMVDNPLDYLEAALKSKVKRVIFHYEIDKSLHEPTIEGIRARDMQAGLAINPQTKINQVKHLFKRIDLLLFMAVNPGYYGSRFIPEVLENVRGLSKTEHSFILALDGGVKETNILDIKDAGVEVACVGSGIFKGMSPIENYRTLCEKVG